MTISGFVQMQAHAGDIDNADLDRTISTGLDFSTDTEVHVLLRREDDETGLAYGAEIELEGDTNRTDNTGETWLFVEGGFGQVRLGDDDGVAENSSVGAHTIAAGTGGLDGTVVDTYGTGFSFLTGSDTSTKIVYYTPYYSGWQVGLSFTPNQTFLGGGGADGDNIASRDVEAGDIVEGAIVYESDFEGDVNFIAALVGLHGEVKDEGAVGGDDFIGGQAGVQVAISNISLAGSYAEEKTGDVRKGFFNAGAAYAFEDANVSISYGQVVRSENTSADGNEWEKPWAVVLSADLGLAPGLVLAGDVALFDNDVEEPTDDGTYPGDDDGWQGVARLGVAF